ncbi:hypothetical protein PG994_014044 [Apiospora phragmitis]|uniref:Uncharacterized protein n=1 Tax=Apiospora phragmitis TaxID=2905665 RepID=A0ABR1T381_9PEZI
MDYGRRSDRYDDSPPRHRRHASNGERPTYREDYYELPPPPPRDGHYYYEDYEMERRRRPAQGHRRPSYSAGPVSRGRRSTSSYGDERDFHHRPHSHHHEKRTTTKRSHDPLDLDLNWKQAAEAAAGAAAVEAWRSRGDPDKMKRVATAAAGAVAVDLALGRGGHDDKNKRHAMESAIGGLVIDRMVNGSSSSSSKR